jgi:hypothetical protein
MAEAIFKWVKDGDVMVNVNTAGNMGDELWDRFVEQLGAFDYKYYIGASLGILELSAPQRKHAASALRNNGVQVVIITDDVLVRGVVTAVSWLGANVKSFAWKDMDRAFARLGVLARKDSLVPIIERLRAECLSEEEERKRKRREQNDSTPGKSG